MITTLDDYCAVELAGDDWLAWRHRGVGASEAAAACGCSPWTTRLELYLRKTGELQRDIATPRMEWGSKLERLIAEDYAISTGLPIEKPPAILYRRDRPWMFASLDYWVPGERVVEIKTVSPFAGEGFGEDGSSEIPTHYRLQVQQQMACCGLEKADLVALMLGSYQTRIYHIERDDAVIQNLADIERDFMESVRLRVPPMPDFEHPSTADLMAMLEPIPGNVAVLGDQEQELADRYIDLGERIKALETERKDAKSRLIHALGTAEEGDLPSGHTIRRRETTRAGYEVQACTFVDFRILKPKKGR